MTRKEDSIVAFEVIQPDHLSVRDAIIVVTWSDNTKSLWFASKAPKYVRKLVQYYVWKGEFAAREILSLKSNFIKNY